MAKTVEFNGEIVEFPDDMSDDDIGAVLSGQYQEQQAAQAAGMTTQQVQEKLPTRNLATGMPEGVPLPYGMSQGMLDAVNKDTQRQNEMNQNMRRDPQFLQKVAASDDAGFFANAGRSLLNTITEFGEGAEDLVDKHLPESISNVLNYRPFASASANNMTPEQRIEERAQQMQENLVDQTARNIGAPVASTVGATLPYLVTGAALENGIVAGMNLASPVTRTIAQNALRGVGRVEVSSIPAVNALGRSANIRASRMTTAPKIVSDFDRQFATTLRAPIIGGAEGGVNYNETVGEGALLSSLGALSGNIGPARLLNRVENVRDAATRKIINEMDAEGFSLTPGVRLGNRQMQTEEAGIRNSDVLGDYFYQKVTRPNERKMTEMAGDAIGLNAKGRDAFAPEELASHMQNLSNQYRVLENNTRGVFGAPQTKQMGEVLKDLQPTTNRNTTPDDAIRYGKVKSIVDQMWKESNAVQNPGAKTVYAFDGTKYQQYRQRLQDEINQAYSQGDSRLGSSLRKIQNALDDSLTNGMSKSDASAWRDLNERYAMTRLLLEKGMTPSGKVNPAGITSAVMKGDEAVRTLTGRGGRIQQFQKMARYNDVLNDVEGGSLTGLGNADYAANRQVNKLPFRYKIPLYARSAARTRLSTLPTYGISPSAGISTMRATMMTDPFAKIANSATMSVEGLAEYLNSLKEGE